MSDQSSHFDSVLGTAINLGIHSVNDKGGLHYPKVSALAREAKELGGVRSKKEEKQPEGMISIDKLLQSSTTISTFPSLWSDLSSTAMCIKRHIYKMFCIS